MVWCGKPAVYVNIIKRSFIYNSVNQVLFYNTPKHVVRSPAPQAS